MVVIDPLVATCGAMDFDEIKEGRSRLQPLRDLCSETGVTAMVIHHLNKDARQGRTNRNRLAGSHQLMAAASADWTMHTGNANDGTRLIEVSCHARRFGSGSFNIRSAGPASFERVEAEEKASAARRLEDLLGNRTGEIVTRAEIGRSSVSIEIGL